MIGSHSLGIIASQRGGGVAMTYAESVIADGAVAYWRLDETSGTVAADSSGNGRDGTYVGSPNLNAPPLITSGTAMESFVNGDRVDSTYDGIVGSAARSLEVWVSTSVQGTLINTGISASSNGRRFQLAINSGSFSPNPGAILVDVFGDQIVGTQDLRDGLPHYLVATFPAGGNTNSIKLYVDGVQQATTSLVGSISINTISGSGLTIGGIASGILDEAAIYDYVLTPQQIADRYALGAA